MGWSYTRGATKEDIIKDCLTGGEHPTGFRAIADSLVGNHLWVAFENETAATCPKGTRFLCLYLLALDSGCGWGCKAMDESSGPCDSDCPLYLLDLVPEPDSEWAKAFRGRVRAFQAAKSEGRKKKQSIRVGDRLILPEGCKPRELTISGVGAKVCGYDSAGRQFRITPKFIAMAEVIAA